MDIIPAKKGLSWRLTPTETTELGDALAANLSLIAMTSPEQFGRYQIEPHRGYVASRPTRHRAQIAALLNAVNELDTIPSAEWWRAERFDFFCRLPSRCDGEQPPPPSGITVLPLVERNRLLEVLIKVGGKKWIAPIAMLEHCDFADPLAALGADKSVYEPPGLYHCAHHILQKMLTAAAANVGRYVQKAA